MTEADEDHGAIVAGLRKKRPTLAVKRAIDLVLGGTLLGLLIVPMLAVALAVRIASPGPALYRTWRHGLNGRPFLMFKFRTMRVAAAAEDRRFRAKVARTGELPKSAADARTTWFGRWLRRSSIDELPQLFNVLIGDMSLVGPRPIMPEMLARNPDFARLRSRVRPGMTGQWQVTARATNTSAESMQAPDLAYIETLSIWRDVTIMLKTIAVVVRGDGAH